jgi:hypothetical protein
LKDENEAASNHFENKSAKVPTMIFSVTERAALEGLGLFREEEAY